MSNQTGRSIRAQLMWLSLIIVTVSVALSLAGTLYITLRTERKTLDQNLLNSASILSQVPLVREALLGGTRRRAGRLSGRGHRPHLGYRSDSGGRHGKRAPLCARPQLYRQPLHWLRPDQRPGRAEPYTLTTAVQWAPTTRPTPHPGRIRGGNRLYGRGALPAQPDPCGADHRPAPGGHRCAGGGSGALLALRLSRRIKRSLMGYEPDAFARRFHQREDILEALEEGFWPSTGKGVSSFSTPPQPRCSPWRRRPPWPPLHSVYPSSTLDRILRTGRPEYNVSMKSLKDVRVLADRLPLYENGALAGAVGIFRNRTEVARLADDLTGVRHMVDAMRAYTHEFMNKLHVILGLLQIGEPERAQQYIMDTTRTQQEAVSRIMNQIKEPSVAALLVGKTSRANELGIRLTLDRESVLSAGTSWLSPTPG